MGKEIKNDYRIKILSELDNSEINKSLIKNVYNVSQKQLNTLGQKKVSLKKPNTVNEVFKLFLNSNWRKMCKKVKWAKIKMFNKENNVHKKIWTLNQAQFLKLYNTNNDDSNEHMFDELIEIVMFNEAKYWIEFIKSIKIGDNTVGI